MARHPNPRWMIAARAAAGILLGVVLGGCSGPDGGAPFAKLFPKPEEAPAPDSPVGVVQLFRWCWEHRDCAKYRELFTADYEFVFAATDSAGSPYRTNPWRREDELIAACNLFAAASGITLTFTPDALTSERDLRPGKTWPWHQRIETSVDLTVVKTDSTGYHVTGGAVFYVVRGDSAQIPPALPFGPDSTRWYIERWEDRTDGMYGGGLHARHGLRPVGAGPDGVAPAKALTWGWLKTQYR